MGVLLRLKGIKKYLKSLENSDGPNLRKISRMIVCLCQLSGIYQQ